MKFDFQPVFWVDLLLPILRNQGAVCQCWMVLLFFINMLPYIRHMYHVAIKICITIKQHVAIKICITIKQHINNIMNNVGQVNNMSTKSLVYKQQCH